MRVAAGQRVKQWGLGTEYGGRAQCVPACLSFVCVRAVRVRVRVQHEGNLLVCGRRGLRGLIQTLTHTAHASYFLSMSPFPHPRPFLPPQMVAPLHKRKIVHKRTKKFVRHMNTRFIRIRKVTWRKPKGIDSCVRRRFKGKERMANIGYGTNKKDRHVMPNGFLKFRVNNVQVRLDSFRVCVPFRCLSPCFVVPWLLALHCNPIASP